MAASPRSVTSSFRPQGERLVVSGLGISSESGDSEVRGPAALAEWPAEVLGAADLVRDVETWVRPPPTKKEMWRKRHGVGDPAGRGHAHEREQTRREVSPEMRDKCFRCLEKGHYKTDCTNDIVCFRCGLSGHGSRDCKRPRSPSPVDELRRDALAKVACRASPGATSGGGGGGSGPACRPRTPA
ncbi:uncharacterized protein, partial [Triticum aestivum]|uniref:uncharacterized protein n=1 Tax=Triticum aestivum TaxID=4565 RepID=UPI001D0145BA